MDTIFNNYDDLLMQPSSRSLDIPACNRSPRTTTAAAGNSSCSSTSSTLVGDQGDMDDLDIELPIATPAQLLQEEWAAIARAEQRFHERLVALNNVLLELLRLFAQPAIVADKSVVQRLLMVTDDTRQKIATVFKRHATVAAAKAKLVDGPQY